MRRVFWGIAGFKAAILRRFKLNLCAQNGLGVEFHNNADNASYQLCRIVDIRMALYDNLYSDPG